jgi:hypothetical protein
MNAAFHSGATARQEDAGEAALSRLAEVAGEFGAAHIQEEARSLAERVSEGRFYVACVGQFKRGKSTLLNALIGRPILPAAVVPITTVPTVIRYGTAVGARLRMKSADWKDISVEALEDYVSEERNPENHKQVEGVEVFAPCPLLATGMCLVDTPGLGSVFSGNTAATQAFVPHIDAAVVVVGADPPIAGEELALVEEVGKHVKDLLVVLNKADRVTEEDRAAAQSFTRRVLEKRLGRPAGPIYEISAAERLENRGMPRDWEKLVGALEQLEAESGRTLIRSAGERGLRRLGEQMLAIVAEERAALLRPIVASEERVAALRRTLADAERSLRELGYLLTAEQHRLSDLFLARRKEFLSRVRPAAEGELAESLRSLPRRYGPGFRRGAMRLAQAVAGRHVLPWLESEQVRAEQEYRIVASRFVTLGNDFLKRLVDSGISELARMPNALDEESGFRVHSRFTFQDLIHVARPASPLRYLADLALGVFGASGRIERQAEEFLVHLLEMNSTRVQSDIVDRVQESRSRLEVEIRKLLHEVVRAAESALNHARAVQAAGSAAVEAALARLESAEGELRSLMTPPAG